MTLVYIKRIMAFIVLVFFQVLVFNHVHLFGYATPFLYIYLLLKLNLGTSRAELLIWGFLLGLAVDIFSNTPGVSAASTTFYALLQPILVRLFTPRHRGGRRSCRWLLSVLWIPPQRREMARRHGCGGHLQR